MTDRELAADMEEMARGSKKQPWSEYRNVPSPATIQLYGYEAVASRTRTYKLILVPGILQTEEYARKILSETFRQPTDRLEQIVEARLERQALLDHPDAPQMDFLIDEAAIRRVVGGPKTMERQLQRISELARTPKVTVQIVPFPAGAHPGMEGPLTHLEFPDPDDDDVVYIEGRHAPHDQAALAVAS